MDVLMPQLGETVAEGKISKWFVAAGDSVKPGDNLFEIETDKVSMEVPAITAGTLAAIHVQAGEIAAVGAVVAVISGKGEAITPSQAKAPSSLTPAKAGVQNKELGPRLRGDERTSQTAPKPAIPMEPFREVRTPERNYGPARLPGGAVVTPLARRLAGEASIDLSRIKGSGPHGRIVARDIETARKAIAPAAAPALATVMLTAEVAIAQALALCAEVKEIELADVMIRAWAMALQRVTPSDETAIAIATGQERAVIRGAASKPLTAIAAARREPVAAGDTQTASTAISISGIAGITSVAEALSRPFTSILGIGAPRRAPVEAADGSVRFVDMMTATLSCDHRAVDGTLGAELLSAFKGFVERPVMMIV